jgi:hypothetical protein
MTTNASDLRMEEYKSLRAEILERIREANTLIITSAGGVGGAYAVMVSTFAKGPHLKFSHASSFTLFCFLVMVWTPVLFAALGRIKSRDIWITVQQIAEHIRTIEAHLYGSSPALPGWEQQMELYRRSPKPLLYRLAHPPYATVYWGMIVSTFLIASGSTGYIMFLSIRRLFI